jgi:hypothetical protein
MGEGEMINAARYIQTLNKLRHALHEKRPKKKTAILQHGNVRPHTARLILQTIQKNGWELLSHPPYYHLRGHHYVTDEAIQEAVRSWCFFKILQRLQKSVDRAGGFVEK